VNQQLLDGAARLGLALSGAQAAALLAYLNLIQKWNKVYNLTAVRDPADMLTHHLLDSLAVVLPLRVQLAAMAYSWDGAHDEVGKPIGDSLPTPAPVFRLLDVGSGAGLPGVVIAICCPEVQVDCVDTVAKKAAFINQVAVSLKLPNLRGLHNRVENLGGLAPGQPTSKGYDVVCSRAFASLDDFTRLSAGALKQDGVWMAMKAKNPVEELSALGPAVKVFHVEQLTVPGLDAERRIVWMRKIA
jgi:16S rRNA (guanine527-N7)-methyltransferase